MNTALQTMTAQDPAQDLAPELFTDFVTWIDRGRKTTYTYISNLRQFAAWLQYSGIARPVRADIIQYREWLTAEHEAIRLDRDAPNGWNYRTTITGEPLRLACKPNTITEYMHSVRQFFRWTAANGFYPDIAANVHTPKISHATHRKEALDVQEVQRIEQSIIERTAERMTAQAMQEKDTAGRIQRSAEQGKRLYAMFELAVTAGLRTVEISRANIRDFETKGGQSWLYIWGKGHTEADQRKALAPEVAQAITDYLECRTDRKTGAAPLFVGTGNRNGGGRLAPATISKILKRAMQEAGYNSERITAHSLRHTAGTACMEITGDIYATQKYMRHSTPATTEIYLHNDTEKTEAGIAKRLYGLFHGEHTDDASRLRLNALVKRMTPEQVDKLADIAQALAS